MELWQENTALCQEANHVAQVINLRMPRKDHRTFPSEEGDDMSQHSARAARAFLRNLSRIAGQAIGSLRACGKTTCIGVSFISYRFTTLGAGI
jgi:hypothetical protein